jgi:hypothetical protein
MERKRAMTENNSQMPTMAVVLNRDLLFGSHIRGALKALGLEATFVPDTSRFMAELARYGDEAAIGILDMNGAIAWDELRTALATSERVVPTLAFGPHVDVANRRAAKAAGVTRVVSNGQFQRDMAALIDRYRRK